MSNTPIAVTALSPKDTGLDNNRFSGNIYYMDNENRIVELWTNDHSLMTNWTVGTPNLPAAKNTQLAAVAYACPLTDECIENPVIFYQNSEFDIMSANSSGWAQAPDSAWKLADGDNNTSFTAVQYVASNNGAVNLTSISELRIFYLSQSNLYLKILDSNGFEFYNPSTCF